MMGLVAGAFGLLSGALGRSALQRWREPPSKKIWLALHIQLMCGAFSAALTAFFVLQLQGLLGSFDWVLWIAPVLVMNRYAARALKRRGLEGD